ncbi:hypothetical protein BAUCODRAFT_379795 [Baudoinia panamericana UAMH 10762]|uniref:C6 transcription factor RegA n=1 Tax=Baudoinia panamericana (strain UAMH 10762) TaxID=717646 RepID=M2N448_BAUPA|nr:uncharacterized protein BAUCODRAFT_379795 [Baudoinia panamericana UAMH 10762]EMC98763.1 hypothetical protein BAUCODRAFT_379795 [Baudoinia panamericana UAMH 10762]
MATSISTHSSASVNGRTLTTLYQCSVCQRAFARVDHLGRHVRTHTLEKPYECEVCGKQFSRVDLLKRHACRHTSSTDARVSRAVPGLPSRVSKACKACAASKLKCTDTKPCQRCVTKSVNCEHDSRVEVEPFSDALGRFAEDRQTYERPSEQSDHASSSGEVIVVGSAPSLGSASSIAPLEPRTHQITPSPDETYTAFSDYDMSQRMDVDVDVVGPSDTYTDFLRSLWEPGQAEKSMLSPPTFELSTDNFWDQYLNADPFRDQSLIQRSFGDLSTPPAVPNSHFNHPPQQDKAPPEQETIQAAARAFQESGWNWVPTPQHHRSAVHEHLSLLQDQVDPACVLQPDLDFSAKRLGHKDRERIMEILLSHCCRKHLARVMSNFPSSEFLEGLMHHALRSQLARPVPLLHVPTFDPAVARAELLAAVITDGACSALNGAVREFGYSMPDILRTAIVENWAVDNSSTRNLQLLQTLLTATKSAMWSGNYCLMEIAESTMAPSITIIRRAGWLLASSYENIAPANEDEGVHLEQKWNKWVEQESRKWLCYQTFILDAEISMSRLISPSMSYTEMLLPYPEPEELWRASTAESWKALYLARQCEPQLPPAPASLFDDVRRLLNDGESPQGDNAVHRHTILLPGLWRLVWAHRELDDMLNQEGADHARNTSFVPSHGEGLARMLNKLRSEMEPTNPPPHSSLVLEYLSMALHAPLQLLQAFAGKDGVTAAQRAYPVLEEWTQAKSARRALWHAGQLLSFARRLPASIMSESRVMIVYHASLTFWNYGVIKDIRHKREYAQATAPMSKQSVCLDRKQTAAMRRFITIGEGEPCLQSDNSECEVSAGDNDSGSNRVPLRKAGQILRISSQILRGNANGGPGFYLPLTDSVARLMDGLASATEASSLGG